MFQSLCYWPVPSWPGTTKMEWMNGGRKRVSRMWNVHQKQSFVGRSVFISVHHYFFIWIGGIMFYLLVDSEGRLLDFLSWSKSLVRYRLDDKNSTIFWNWKPTLRIRLDKTWNEIVISCKDIGHWWVKTISLGARVFRPCSINVRPAKKI